MQHGQRGSLDDAGKQLEKMAHEFIEGPRKTLQSCQATLGNCQENFQVLHSALQHNLQPALPLLKSHAEPTKPVGSHNTIFNTAAKVQMPRSSSTTQLSNLKPTTEDLATDPWNVLPAFLRTQELAAIDAARQATGVHQQPSQPQVSLQPTCYLGHEDN